MKKVNNLYNKIINFENIYKAYERSSKGRLNKNEIIKFNYNLEDNLMILLNKLKNKTYKTGKFYKFKVYEPKEREISALPFEDRIVHHLYTHEFLIPYFANSFISDSYACIKGKGVHKSSLQLTKYIRKYEYDYYILKLDIKKYFYSINKDILYSLIENKCKDKDLLLLTKEVIYSYKEDGIPIGNYPSQYYANIYLNELDKYVKHKLKIKHYIRYMDDFLIFTKNEKEAKRIYILIEIFLNRKLKLKLNKKSKIVKSPELIDFCGYRHHKHYKLIRSDSKARMLEKIYNYNKDYETAVNKYGKNDIEDHFNFREPVIAFKIWHGHIKHANSYNLYNVYKRKLAFYYDYLKEDNDIIHNVLNYDIKLISKNILTIKDCLNRNLIIKKHHIKIAIYMTNPYNVYKRKQSLIFKHKNKNHIKLLYKIRHNLNIQLMLDI